MGLRKRRVQIRPIARELQRSHKPHARHEASSPDHQVDPCGGQVEIGPSGLTRYDRSRRARACPGSGRNGNARQHGHPWETSRAARAVRSKVQHTPGTPPRSSGRIDTGRCTARGMETLHNRTGTPRTVGRTLAPEPTVEEVTMEEVDEPNEDAPPKGGTHATRPPPHLDAKSIASAVKLGLLSAGLAWLQTSAGFPTFDNGVSNASLTSIHAPEQRWKALADVPIVGEPPRFAREVVLPPPVDFVWPRFAFIALYEHSGEEREANAQVTGELTASVSDRRSILEPSRSCWHFIGTVQMFISLYPHSIPRQSNHITCGFANWASWRSWRTKILDGSMRRSAEEFLWVNCLGDRSMGEQPQSAHQHTIGPPTFVMNGNQHGAANKTYCMWARGLPAVQPTNVLSTDQQWSELAVSGTPEQKTVKRSYTPRSVALAIARAHAQVQGGDTSEFGRPADVPCRMYDTWRVMLAHNFGLLTAHYASAIETAWLHKRERAPALLLVPVSQFNGETCAMIKLGTRASVFSVARDQKVTGEAQGEKAAECLRSGLATQYVAKLDSFGHEDAVVMVPWQQPPTHVVKTKEQLALVYRAGLCATWCTVAALHDHVA